jgi:DNA-binding NarL/FixJ family response regulator
VIRVLVVDDHQVVRSALERLLAVEDGMRSVGAARTCHEAIAAFGAERPDAVIVDYRLPDGDGLSLCRTLERASWPAPVIVFSGYTTGELAVAAAVAGATGVVSKGAPGNELLESVRDVVYGRAHGFDVPAELIRRAGELIDPDDLPILGLRLEFCSPAEIADTLRCRLSEIQMRIDRVVDCLRPGTAGPAWSSEANCSIR